MTVLRILKYLTKQSFVLIYLHLPYKQKLVFWFFYCGFHNDTNIRIWSKLFIIWIRIMCSRFKLKPTKHDFRACYLAPCTAKMVKQYKFIENVFHHKNFREPCIELLASSERHFTVEEKWQKEVSKRSETIQFYLITNKQNSALGACSQTIICISITYLWHDAWLKHETKLALSLWYDAWLKYETITMSVQVQQFKSF